MVFFCKNPEYLDFYLIMNIQNVSVGTDVPNELQDHQHSCYWDTRAKCLDHKHAHSHTHANKQRSLSLYLVALRTYILLEFYIFLLRLGFSKVVLSLQKRSYVFRAPDGLSDASLQCHTMTPQEVVAHEWPANGRLLGNLYLCLLLTGTHVKYAHS